MQTAEGRERRAAQEARTEWERLEAVLKQLPVGGVIAEAPSGQLVLYSEKAEKICEKSFMSGIPLLNLNHTRFSIRTADP